MARSPATPGSYSLATWRGVRGVGADQLDEGTSNKELREHTARMVDLGQRQIGSRHRREAGGGEDRGNGTGEAHCVCARHSFITTDSGESSRPPLRRGARAIRRRFGSPEALISFPFDQVMCARGAGDDGEIEHWEAAAARGYPALGSSYYPGFQSLPHCLLCGSSVRTPAGPFRCR